MQTFVKRALAVGLLVVAPTLLASKQNISAAALPANAPFHLALSKAEPGKSDTVATSPKVIKLWFTESVDAKATGIQVTGAGNHVVALGDITIDAAPKSPAVAEVKETLKPGSYTVDWKAMSDDGHPVKGTFVFTVGAKTDH